MNPAYFAFGAFVLISSWPDGTETCYPATTLADCQTAAKAYTTGPSRSGAHNPTAAKHAICTTYSQVKNKHPNCLTQIKNCIQNYNCPKNLKETP